MSVESELELFGVKLKKDLQRSLNEKQRAKAAKYGRSYNENSTLNNSIRYVVKDTGSSTEFTLYMEDYGNVIDKGRRKTEKTGSGAVKKGIENWIKIKGINPVKVMADIKRKSSPLFMLKTRITGPRKSDKPLTFAEASKTLSFLISRKIHKDGFKGNNFYSQVLNDGRLDKLKVDLEKELKKEVIIVIRDGSNS